MSGEKLITTDVVRLKPNQYIHLLDNNANTVTLLVGPRTYTRLDHEYFTTAEPQSYIAVPPQKYCIITNPVIRDAQGCVVFDAYGQAKVRLGEREIRLACEPFPLYPKEVISQDVTQLLTINENQALRLRCTVSFTEADGSAAARRAGDEWICRGPLTYVPRIEVDVVSVASAIIVSPMQAVKLRATANYFDAVAGVQRKSGEEWLVDKPGAFIPQVNEEVMEVTTATILTERKAIYVGALRDFTDRFGKVRSTGDQWLVTVRDAETFLPWPQEVLVSSVDLTVVGQRQYAIVENVHVNGKSVLGRKELRRGLCSFFLHPGEVLVGNGVREVLVLTPNQALLLRAVRDVDDAPSGGRRNAGARWLMRGPCEYVPPIDVEVVECRTAIPLDVNEGVYIRNITTGVIRAHIGRTVMLSEDEELWSKELDPLVEELLQLPKLTKIGTGPSSSAGTALKPRDKTRVVTCNVPHNALVQVYDYEAKLSHVVLGPDQVMLMPDEEFTVLSLSGGRPKKPDVIKTLCCQLGPDFMSDEILIETLDHARLQLVLSYNWEFDPAIAVGQRAAFTVPDFVGDACKAIASRIRGFVSNETFDAFHRNSSNIIKLAVFGMNSETGLLNSTMTFDVNGLIITNVDVHSVDPVDPKTREALTKSVQLAIEITTKSQEAIAVQQATALEQAARGKLERQIIKDKSLVEVERRGLLEVEARNAAIESTGSSKAQASASADALLLEGQSEVDLAEKRANAFNTTADAEMEVARWKRDAELDYREAMYNLEIAKAREMALIEAEKFNRTVSVIGRETIKAIARAGPELQVKLLSGLGLQGYLVTDGTNPINLLNTAKGLTQAGRPAAN